MKRLSLLGLLAISTGFFAGCPIYDDSGIDPECRENCDPPPTTSTGDELVCFAQEDCKDINQTCGSDGLCHTGDCTLWGCVDKQECLAGVDMKAHCGDPGAGPGGTAGTGGIGGTGGSTAGSAGSGAGGSAAGSGGTGGGSTGGSAGSGAGGSAAGSGGSGGGGAGSGGTGGGGAGGGSGGTGGSQQVFMCPGGAAPGGQRGLNQGCIPGGTDDFNSCCNADLGLICKMDAANVGHCEAAP